MHIPPFTVSAEAINLIAEISGQVERYAIRLEQEDGLRLRKANRIKTIHSSLAIEGNTLSEDEVRDIIDGKNVVAPIRQIQEVRNAIKTYEMYPTLDAINASTKAGQSGPFIYFMLKEIYKTLKAHQGDPHPNKLIEIFPNKVPNKLRDKHPKFSDTTWDVYAFIEQTPNITSNKLGAILGISDRMVRKHISALRDAELIVRVGSNKTGYWEVRSV